MLISIKAGAIAVLIGSSLAGAASAETYQAGNQPLNYDAFAPLTVETTVATDKAGHKMRIVRTKDGHVMVLVPAEVFMALPPSANAFDRVMQ